MKKLELIMGISLLIITTAIIVIFPFVVPFSNSNLALVMLLSAMGYIASYLYIDSYLIRLEIDSYFEGFDDGKETSLDFTSKKLNKQ